MADGWLPSPLRAALGGVNGSSLPLPSSTLGGVLVPQILTPLQAAGVGSQSQPSPNCRPDLRVWQWSFPATFSPGNSVSVPPSGSWHPLRSPDQGFRAAAEGRVLRYLHSLEADIEGLSACLSLNPCLPRVALLPGKGPLFWQDAPPPQHRGQARSLASQHCWPACVRGAQGGLPRLPCPPLLSCALRDSASNPLFM